MTSVIEGILGWIFQNQKGRDAKAFTTLPAFEDFTEPTVDITSPDCGPTNSTLGVEFTHDGAGKVPTLEWKAPEDIASSVQEWLLVSEDPDAPLPTPICHGIYAGIPASKTRVEPDDFVVQIASEFLLKGGFHYGQNRNGKVYIPPRPLINHGVHRYFFIVVALSAPLAKELLKSKVSREQVAEAIKGKVLGWGLWVGRAERKWS